MKTERHPRFLARWRAAAITRVEYVIDDLVQASVDQLSNCGRLSRRGDLRRSIPRSCPILRDLLIEASRPATAPLAPDWAGSSEFLGAARSESRPYSMLSDSPKQTTECSRPTRSRHTDARLSYKSCVS